MDPLSNHELQRLQRTANPTFDILKYIESKRDHSSSRGRPYESIKVWIY